jgi:hypothetical protein
VFDRAAWNRLKYQLDCPLHSQRLMQPTTLHTLLIKRRRQTSGLTSRSTTLS